MIEEHEGAAGKLAVLNDGLEVAVHESQSFAVDTLESGCAAVPCAAKVKPGLPVPAGAGESSAMNDSFEL